MTEQNERIEQVESTEMSAAEHAISKSVEKLMQLTDPEEPIRLDCDLEDHTGEFVLYKRAGWKFSHLVEYEEAQTSRDTAVVIGKRIVDWNLTDGEGNSIPFAPKDIRQRMERMERTGEGSKNERIALEAQLQTAYAKTFLEFPPDVMRFLITTYRLAYTIAGALPKKR